VLIGRGEDDEAMDSGSDAVLVGIGAEAVAVVEGTKFPRTVESAAEQVVDGATPDGHRSRDRIWRR
jgi:hypothetical protein